MLIERFGMDEVLLQFARVLSHVKPNAFRSLMASDDVCG